MMGFCVMNEEAVQADEEDLGYEVSDEALVRPRSPGHQTSASRLASGLRKPERLALWSPPILPPPLFSAYPPLPLEQLIAASSSASAGTTAIGAWRICAAKTLNIYSQRRLPHRQRPTIGSAWCGR
jgi:hypothetical protein